MSSVKQEVAAILMDFTDQIPEKAYMDILNRLSEIPDHKDPKKATEFAKNAIREIETDITNKFSKIQKPKSNAKPPILKRVTVPKPRMLKDLVKNIDPEMSGMSELTRVIEAKSGKLPSWRMKKGGIKDYEEIYQNAVEEGFYPERAYRSDSPDIGMPQNFIDDIADKIHPEDIEGYDNA